MEQSPGQVTWRRTSAPVGYAEAVAAMEHRVGQIAAGTASECVWLVQHPPLYTRGTRAEAGEIVESAPFPIFATGRGGRVTYHGPGQRIAYVMVDLRARGSDVRAFVRGLEAWLIAVLRDFGIAGETRDGRIGVWVRNTVGGDAKIAAIGIRVRRGVTFHGVSLNLDPDLSHYDAIVPCGIRDAGVTSLRRLGLSTSMEDVDAALMRNFAASIPPRMSPGTP